MSNKRRHGKSPIVRLAIMVGMVLIGTSAIGAKVPCDNCQTPKKPLPVRSVYWESKLGLAALTQAPFVEVMLSGDVRAQQEVLVLSRYTGAQQQIRSAGQPVPGASLRGSKSI